MPQFGDRTALGPGGQHVPGRSDRHGPDEPPNAHRSRIARRWRQRVAAQNFQVQDFGKLYRSRGNCSSQFKRAVSIQNVTVTAPGKTLAGVNANYGDRRPCPASRSSATPRRRSASATGTRATTPAASRRSSAPAPTGPSAATPPRTSPTARPAGWPPHPRRPAVRPRRPAVRQGGPGAAAGTLRPPAPHGRLHPMAARGPAGQPSIGRSRSRARTAARARVR